MCEKVIKAGEYVGPRSQLEYKTQLAGGFVITADKWFASSKLCSTCDCKNEELTLDMRSWTCQNCGVTHDRDTNAAINLRKLALEYRERINACGEVVSLRENVAASVNQEQRSEMRE